MRIRFNVVVASDDGQFMQEANNELLVDTSLYGLDPSVAKHSFLNQAEALVRTISDSQLPALYQAVVDAMAKAHEDEQRDATESMKKLHGKLDELRAKKANQEAAPDKAEPDTAEPDTAPETVQCTGCGATISSDAAHFVSVVVDGKYDHDATLCDKCHKETLEAQK